MPQSQVDPAFSERLGRALGPEFEVRDLLGSGGFADVYEIRERRLDRSLAVKVLRPEIAWGPWMVSRFEREARALASLNHLNIPPIHFVGDNEGLVYYVMPLISGVSLGDRLAAEGPLPPGDLVDAMIPVLDALHHAHHLGIVHRDVTPDNIVIEKENARPLLVDFGIAQQLRRSPAGSTSPEGLTGTPGYLSPELAAGEREADFKVDIYSAGATLYHLLTGTPPVEGRPPHQVHPGIPAWLSAIVMRALEPDPDRRFASAAEMADALRNGRLSGGAVGQTMEAVDHIREDDPTPKMVKIEADPALSHPWQRRTGSRRHRRSRSTISSWIIFLGLVGTVAAYFILVPLTFTLRNNLLVPVELSPDGGETRTIPAGALFSIPLPQQGRIFARWFVVQPALQGGDIPVGETVSGVIRIESPNGKELLLRRVRRSIDSWSDGSAIFAPRIVNRTTGPVRVSVLRSNSPTLCNCSVDPGETVLLGYYRLDPSSAVRVTPPRGSPVVFRNLESLIDLNSGLMQLEITGETFTSSGS